MSETFRFPAIRHPKYDESTTKCWPDRNLVREAEMQTKFYDGKILKAFSGFRAEAIIRRTTLLGRGVGRKMLFNWSIHTFSERDEAWRVATQKMLKHYSWMCDMCALGSLRVTSRRKIFWTEFALRLVCYVEGFGISSSTWRLFKWILAFVAITKAPAQDKVFPGRIKFFSAFSLLCRDSILLLFTRRLTSKGTSIKRFFFLHAH